MSLFPPHLRAAKGLAIADSDLLMSDGVKSSII
jgi:hypothetical protein